MSYSKYLGTLALASRLSNYSSILLNATIRASSYNTLLVLRTLDFSSLFVLVIVFCRIVLIYKLLVSLKDRD